MWISPEKIHGFLNVTHQLLNRLCWNSMGGCRLISLFQFLSKHNNPQRARFVVLVNYSMEYSLSNLVLFSYELYVIIKFSSYRLNINKQEFMRNNLTHIFGPHNRYHHSKFRTTIT
jgi:hypothetical protein